MQVSGLPASKSRLRSWDLPIFELMIGGIVSLAGWLIWVWWTKPAEKFSWPTIGVLIVTTLVVATVSRVVKLIDFLDP